MNKKKNINKKQNKNKCEYISIDEFSKIAGVKVETIKRRKNEIPGLTYENGEYLILRGTRYPGKYKNWKFKDSKKRRYVLLKAISQYRYISHIDLRVYQEQFEDFIRELLSAELIKENHLGNNYGANAYDITSEGEQILLNSKYRAIKEISNCIASAAGHFAGAVISEIFDI